MHRVLFAVFETRKPLLALFPCRKQLNVGQMVSANQCVHPTGSRGWNRMLEMKFFVAIGGFSNQFRAEKFFACNKHSTRAMLYGWKPLEKWEAAANRKSPPQSTTTRRAMEGFFCVCVLVLLLFAFPCLFSEKPELSTKQTKILPTHQ